MTSPKTAVNIVPAAAGDAPPNADTTSSPTATRPKRFVIKKWNAVCFWSWINEADDCDVCGKQMKYHLVECPRNQAGATSEEITVAGGVECSSNEASAMSEECTVDSDSTDESGMLKKASREMERMEIK